MSSGTSTVTPRFPTGVAHAAEGRTGIPPVPALPSQLQGTMMAGRWPLRDFMELGPLPEAVPCARLHTQHILWEWGISRLGESAGLVVAELMNNAVAASRALPWLSPVRLWLLSDRLSVVVLVWDASPQPPQPGAIDLDAENGRGLLLVEAHSDRWDWYTAQGIGGKVVWALVRHR
jgi:hypothetical protein